jgi:hypothetical protein
MDEAVNGLFLFASANVAFNQFHEEYRHLQTLHRQETPEFIVSQEKDRARYERILFDGAFFSW